MKLVMMTAGLAVSIAGVAMGQTSYDSSVTPNWPLGSGQPNGGFVVNDNTGLLVQTGLSSWYRWGVRNPNDFALRDSMTDNVYTYRSGTSYTDGNAVAVAPGTSSFNISFHANLNTGTGGSIGQNFTNNTVLLTIDWDPTAGVDQRTYNYSAAAIALGGGSGTILQQSQNLGFGFWDSPSFLALTGATARTSAFDPNALGTYRVQIDIVRGGNTISSSEMFVNVVPTPGAAAALGMGLMAVGRRRR